MKSAEYWAKLVVDCTKKKTLFSLPGIFKKAMEEARAEERELCAKFLENRAKEMLLSPGGTPNITQQMMYRIFMDEAALLRSWGTK